MRRMLLVKPILLTFLCGLSAVGYANQQAPEVQIGVGENSGNYCSGGLEDRKLIELGEGISDQFKQTTQLDCQSAGGVPLIMPDLPAPKTERQMLA